jgi:hypothetical protein
MIINDPKTHAEVTVAFRLYEKALVSNDVKVLDQLFWNSSHTIRYGITENLYGANEILAFRKARPSTGLARSISRTVITTYGKDFATASTLFHRENAKGKTGRQMQSWARFLEGWKVVAAHVSIIDDPAQVLSEVI